MQYYLQHHGIKGQKWGVKNGPPYPLNNTKRNNHNTGQPVHSGERSVEQIVRKYQNRKVGTIDPVTLTYVAVSVATVAIPPLVVAADKASEKYKLKHSRMKNSTLKSVGDLPKLTKPMTAEENMKVTNPGFPKDGRVFNCTFCTASMAMREKGYDVHARESSHAWYNDILFQNTFTNVSKRQKMSHNETAKSMLKKLAAEGDGAYGDLSVVWNLGGGHSIFWKNENGKTRIFDGQSGEEYDVNDIKNSKLFNNIIVPASTYVRLDKSDPTEYILSIVEPRKEENT